MMQSAASSFMEMNQSHDEMNSSDIEEELDLALEENMSLLSLSNGRNKISPSDTSLDLSGFFSDEDEIFYEETVDYTVGCNKSDYMKSMSDPGYLDIDDNVRALETRSPKNNFYSVQGSANSSIYATGASVFSGYSSPPSGNKVKSPSQPIDIVYGREERDYRRTKSSGRLQRNLFCDTKARREDWREKAWERKRDQVLLEGFSDNYSDRYIKTTDSATEVSIDSPSTPKSTMKPCSRSRNLTNVDLDELKGCLDLGFGFNYEELPELSNTLPALELCYAIGQKFQDDNQKSSPVSILDAGDSSSGDSYTQSPIANWKISSPGDHPQQVKARLKVWAQAVACTVRLCS